MSTVLQISTTFIQIEFDEHLLVVRLFLFWRTIIEQRGKFFWPYVYGERKGAKF